jgi:acyl dehydratase
MIVFDGIPDLVARVGEDLGTSSAYRVTQEAVDAFAELTGDRYWIHTDPARAAAQTPFGGTIAHGLFTLSLGPRFSYELYDFRGVALGVNYGYGRVRFPAPLPVGSSVRMRATLAAVDASAGAATVTVTHVFEREGGDKPVCVADSMVRLFAGEGRAG